MTKPRKKSPRSEWKNINQKIFHIEFKNESQKEAWEMMKENDITFLLGPAGTAKSFLSIAYGISEILAKKKNKLILTRPAVDAGEKLGHLPGDLIEKVDPYMAALYGAIDKCVGPSGPDRDRVDACLELAPLAFMRGSTFDNSICILDEAQNATFSQLKLFVTRLGENSKMIINGDPEQSDLFARDFALDNFVDKLEFIEGIGIMEFSESDIVRHPLVSKILKELAR